MGNNNKSPDPIELYCARCKKTMRSMQKANELVKKLEAEPKQLAFEIVKNIMVTSLRVTAVTDAEIPEEAHGSRDHPYHIRGPYQGHCETKKFWGHRQNVNTGKCQCKRKWIESRRFIPESLRDYSKGMENLPWFENDNGYCIAWQYETYGNDSQNGNWICVDKYGKLIQKYSTETLGLGQLNMPEYVLWP